MNNHSYSEKDLDFLLSPSAIRKSAEEILQLTIAGKTNFVYHPEEMDTVVNYVLEVIRDKYPTLDIPFHSRWGHFRVGNVDRIKILDAKLSEKDALAIARTKFDLVITSVLLDAGAGDLWSYEERNTGQKLSRSEGLAVASFYLFMQGHLSSHRTNPLQVDSLGLRSLSEKTLRSAFQVTAENPLIGVEGRLSLLKNLGEVLLSKKDLFPGERPGGLVDYLLNRYGYTVTGPQVLRAVLDGLGEIWPGRVRIGTTNLGDIWSYSKISGGLAAFHKLSQWMSYSLMEPLLEAGFEVQEVEQLTGLAEYRNGGLLLDLGLITLKDTELQNRPLRPDSEVVIEWRGLTISLLDRIGAEVRKKLKKSSQDFPLAKVLEGGTWWAGRKAAGSLRKDQSPPLQIESDGTVF
ncbi:MAG: uracil phosphoribosyltransferase [Bdellovibrio sp. ArHS]|uniref:DUF1688 family protein n=1 Tax=Bdellovibrio sp. ArHS TaxID=1569284 RepID=UPI0005827570|nr:DUF1688 family protein [Bdellovibrio sp. ArHS]KHD89680.1 MAG: uracil phosphoribosyltransferase [Bdellovibrio sp. ArHS]